MRPFAERKATLTRRTFLTRSAQACALTAAAGRVFGAEHEVLPRHVSQETLRAVTKGLDYLAGIQSEDGSWINAPRPMDC
jgi:hypothetical protein